VLYLTEISISIKAAVDTTINLDPLVASDIDYCVKTWMADKPSLACRPWRATSQRGAVRITGWRGTAASYHDRAVYLGTRPIALQAGQRLALTGRFVPLRRSKAGTRDAAKGRADPAVAYGAWLQERLVDLMPFATLDEVRISASTHRRVLRKVAHGREHTGIREELIPVVEADVLLTVGEPASVEAWLLHGLGPQKAFGYGAFLPAIDFRTRDAQ
jgi:hypothetical protein